MNDEAVPLTVETAALQEPPPPVVPDIERLFEKPDWLSLGITSLPVLTVYLCTLAPEVTLGWSGIYAASSMYGGVTIPPGYPLWTIYTWLFIHLLPFSNVAWRISVSSAVAGALACGVIALMTSRCSGLILEGIHGLRRCPVRQEQQLRAVVGFVAGAAFGFDRTFWGLAVTVEPDPLAMLLFALTLCLLLRWIHSHRRKMYLFAATFAYGLSFTTSQELAAAALGLLCLVSFVQPAVGRDLFLGAVLFVAAILLANSIGPLGVGGLRGAYIFSGLFCAMAFGAGVIKTRQLLTEWRSVLGCGFALLVALSTYLYLPLVSMANPPVNWGYAREPAGFFHVLSRGQFERFHPTDSFSRFIPQAWYSLELAFTHFGWIYLLPAAIPFCFLRRLPARERGWMLGLASVFLCLKLFTVAMTNPPLDEAGRDFNSYFLYSAHLILAVWTGCGLAILGSWLTGAKNSENGQEDFRQKDLETEK